MYHLYRRLIALRSSHAALLSGDQQLLDTPDGVVGWRRFDPDGIQHVTVLVNFGGEPVDVAVDPDRDGENAATLLVILSSDGLGEHTAFTGRLGANQSVVLAGHR